MVQGSLSLVRGDNQVVGLTISNPDASVYNLSGCSVIFTARESNTYFSPVILTKTVTGHVDPTVGSTQITFATGDTANLDSQTKYFDIKLINISGSVNTLIYGELTIVPL